MCWNLWPFLHRYRGERGRVICFGSDENWGGADVGERDKALVRGCRDGLSCMLRGGV